MEEKQDISKNLEPSYKTVAIIFRFQQMMINEMSVQRMTLYHP